MYFKKKQTGLKEYLGQVTCGDCLRVMKKIPSNSIDTVITDPPAAIGFMNKHWDKDRGGREKWIDWLSEIMTECLRLTKPGGSLLCWSIPRTSHWTGMAIENAGWRIVNKISHFFSSGFPKSLDISKAIDKAKGAKRKVINQKIRGNVEKAKQSGNTYARADANKGNKDIFGYGVEDITVPATDLAKLWDGWGTSLKPAREDWWLAYKPLDGTYAQNAEKWDVAGLWIDGGRIRTAENCSRSPSSMDGQHCYGKYSYPIGGQGSPQGRWPANLLMSCSCDYQLKSGIMKESKKKLIDWLYENA